MIFVQLDELDELDKITVHAMRLGSHLSSSQAQKIIYDVHGLACHDCCATSDLGSITCLPSLSIFENFRVGGVKSHLICPDKNYEKTHLRKLRWGDVTESTDMT